MYSGLVFFPISSEMGQSCPSLACLPGFYRLLDLDHRDALFSCWSLVLFFLVVSGSLVAPFLLIGLCACRFRDL